MFGSDFSINLLGDYSYNSYLVKFINHFDNDELSHLLSTENPERFLFGEINKQEMEL
jgi:hypothetical protein